jgi:hypothetical protein
MLDDSHGAACVTGSAGLAAELAPKQLQLLNELIPNAAAYGILADPAGGTHVGPATHCCECQNR